MMTGAEGTGPCSEVSEVIEQGPLSVFVELDEFAASERATDAFRNDDSASQHFPMVHGPVHSTNTFCHLPSVTFMPTVHLENLHY